jgi:hypothetical protein
MRPYVTNTLLSYSITSFLYGESLAAAGLLNGTLPVLGKLGGTCRPG